MDCGMWYQMRFLSLFSLSFFPIWKMFTCLVYFLFLTFLRWRLAENYVSWLCGFILLKTSESWFDVYILAEWYSHCRVDITIVLFLWLKDAVSLARTEDDPESAARKLTEAAFTRGSADNITCIVVRFHHENTEMDVDVLDHGELSGIWVSISSFTCAVHWVPLLDVFLWTF